MFANQRPLQLQIAERHARELAKHAAVHARLDPCANVQPLTMKVDRARARGLRFSKASAFRDK